MLHLTGSLDLAEDATVVPVSPELVAAPKLADLMFLIDVGGHRTLEILEALAYWDDREIVRIARRYGTAMMVPEYDPRPIKLTIALLGRKAEERLPATLPVDRGGGKLEVYPRYVRMWELDPVGVIRLNRPSLLPWVALMERTTPDLLEQAARGVANDEELLAHFAVLASLKYERERIDALLGRFTDMMTVQIAEQTPLGKWIREAGREQGRVEGKIEGKIESVQRFLRQRFPALEAEFSPTGLDAAAVEHLLDALYGASDEVAARRAIGAAKA